MNKNMTFETAMNKLNEIVAKLESGTQSLNASLKLFEQGSELTAFCYSKLQHAEQNQGNYPNGTRTIRKSR